MKTDSEGTPLGKRALDKAKRRETILEIAQRSFLEQGYDRTTMSGIAEAMGGSKGTLWSYFETKEILFEAMIERAAAHFRADLLATLDPGGQPEVGLRDFAETFIRKITSPDSIALQRVVIGESARFPELGPIFYTRAAGVTRSLLARYIGAHMAADALRKDDPLKAANMLVSLCSGGQFQRVLWGTETCSEAMIAEEAATAVDYFLRVFGRED
ncbi:TetR/AcrR family transcriptional regulator [Novosphingobium terrae]|uniref:TetR/AcrR family transcriptional regulator n=1 Tax=Novosphingobium terrae TaxID=2726189 RepID=UPI0019825426|nr:TetR/AcrR family transcriptional regulator [Novosphingobium terrae]